MNLTARIEKEVAELEDLVRFHQAEWFIAKAPEAMHRFSLTIAHLSAKIRQLKDELEKRSKNG
jgi:hypothetical protein